MSNLSQSVIDQCEDLRHRLARLTPAELQSDKIQDSLHSLLESYTTTKKRKIHSPADTDKPRPELATHRMSSSAATMLSKVVKGVAGERWDCHRDSLLFSALKISSENTTALSLLATYFTHRARTGTETRILSILVSHAIDCATIAGDGHNATIQRWAGELGRSPKTIINIERAGKCCIEIMENRHSNGEVFLELAGVGLLAMMPSHTTSLKDLAGEGHNLLRACKNIPGFEHEARKRAPSVRLGISRVVEQCGLSIDDDTRLGYLVMQYDRHVSSDHDGTGVSQPSHPNSRGEQQHHIGPTESSHTSTEDSSEHMSPSEESDQLTRRDSVSGSPEDVMLAELLALLHSLPSNSIAEKLLLKGTEHQKRWNDQGFEATIGIADTSIKSSYAKIFQDRASLLDLLSAGVQRGVLVRHDGSVRAIPLENGDGSFSHDVLVFLSYVCPRDVRLEPNFHETMKDLLPLVEKLFDGVDGQNILAREPGIIFDASDMWPSVASARRYMSVPKLPHAMEQCLADDDVPPYLPLTIAYAQSVILRRQGKYSESDEIIQNTLRHASLPDIRTHCLAAELKLSLAENAILRNEYPFAESIVDEIDLPHDVSTGADSMLFRSLDRKWATKARIRRFLGQFSSAVEPLLSCLRIRRILPGTNICHVARPLADIYVELGQYNEAEKVLEESLAGLSSAHDVSTRTYSRLCLSRVDLEIAQGRYGTASNLLSGIAPSLDLRRPMSQTDQLDHVRAVVASARIMMHTSRWEDLLAYSSKAFHLIEQYSCFTTTNYYRGYILLLRALARLQLAAADLKVASECVQEPRHFMTGVGTFDRLAVRMSLDLALVSCAKTADQVIRD